MENKDVNDYTKEEKFILNKDDADELIAGNFEKHPEVAEGIWSIFTRDYRYIFYEHKCVLDIYEFHDYSIADGSKERLSYIWN